MDENAVRAAVEAHAQAVVDPIDVVTLRADLIDDLHPQLSSLAGALPQPVTSAKVTSLEVADDHADAVITYRGADSELAIASRWEDRGAGRPQVVSAVPQA